MMLDLSETVDWRLASRLAPEKQQQKPKCDVIGARMQSDNKQQTQSSSSNNISNTCFKNSQIIRKKFTRRRGKMFHEEVRLLLINVVVVIVLLLCCCLARGQSQFGQHFSGQQHQASQFMAQQPQDSSSSSSSTSSSFSCGKLFYRTLYLDQQRNVLYVGAMDNVFRLNLANVNRTNCLDDAISLEPTDTNKCIAKGRSDNYECRNHIKVIQPMSRHSDRLYVCGTNAYSPRDYLLHGANLTVSSDLVYGVGVGAGPVLARCPFDPDDNSTALWVERGNPLEAPALYTGTVTDYNRADPLIFRTELYNQSSGQKVADAKRTTKFDSKWLDKPNFIGSFDIGDYVYFFFRESAVEYINCGKSIYSRVARVCKRDNGYKPTMYEKVWTSFSKARLNCSIPGEFPFYFDEIQSIYRNPYDERKFHAVFTTNSNGLAGSAICSFSLDAIQDAFNGKFKEQQSSASAWLPVSAQLAPKVNHSDPRPGTCVDDTHALSENLVTFIRGHPLMDSAVANDNGRPVFYRRDILFTKIVVDIMQIDGITYTIYFAGTNTGHVYKIVEWLAPATTPSGGDSADQQQQTQHQAQSSLVEVIEATVPEPVRAMELSSRFKSLYVASDSQVKQIHLLQCKQRHDSCLQCVRDPYCGWDRKHAECRHYSPTDPSNLIQDVTGELPSLCHTHIKHKDVHVTWGQSVHLPCHFNGFIQETQDLQQLLASQARQQLQGHSATMGVGGNVGAGGNLLYQHSPRTTQNLADQTMTTANAMQNIGQTHGIVQPAQYIQWYFHRRENPHGPGISVTQQRRSTDTSGSLTANNKYILAADQGLVIMNSNESGWFQCRLGNQIIHSYNLIVDTKTCAAPNENEFKRIYADWCREMEQYKLLQKNWHAKQNRCQAAISQQQQQQHLQIQHHQQQDMQFLAQNYQQQMQQQQQQTRHHDMWTPSG